MCEKLPFFHSPAVVRKGTFLHNFFFSEYRFWSQVGASGVVYLSFLRIYDVKMINFSAQWHIKVFLKFKLFEILNFLFWITPTAIWECIPWIPGFNGKTRRNMNDFFLEVSCVKNYHFFTAPRWSEKALFCTIVFSSNIDTDHRSVHLGWLIWVFWECMVKKMINFQAQWHIKEFYNSNFFEFWFFCFKSLLWLFGSVFHGSQGSLAKCEETRMIFF